MFIKKKKSEERRRKLRKPMRANQKESERLFQGIWC